MKQKTLTKKLALSKATISNLNEKEMTDAKGGVSALNCWTVLRDQCNSQYPEFCPPFPTVYPNC